MFLLNILGIFPLYTDLDHCKFISFKYTQKTSPLGIQIWWGGEYRLCHSNDSCLSFSWRLWEKWEIHWWVLLYSRVTILSNHSNSEISPDDKTFFFLFPLVNTHALIPLTPRCYFFNQYNSIRIWHNKVLPRHCTMKGCILLQTHLGFSSIIKIFIVCHHFICFSLDYNDHFGNSWR